MVSFFSESEDGQKELDVYQELGEDIIKQRKVRLLFFGVIKQVKIISQCLILIVA